MTLATWLNIAGLGVDFVGAVLLAFDALYGPHARLQAAERRTRLAIENENKERCERRQLELSESSSDSKPDAVSQNQHALSSLIRSIAATTAELRHWERHEHRSQRNAVHGLALLIVGFAFQAASSLVMNLSD
jgi:hypothetical protein